METAEKPQQKGGIINYFQGATINNLVINGNMVKSGIANWKKRAKNNLFISLFCYFCRYVIKKHNNESLYWF